MKTILWAAITANGAYMHGGEGYRWPKQVFDEFDADALKAGTCVLGRKTYDEYADSGGTFGELEVIVVSRTERRYDGATCVTGPRQALAALERDGHSIALIGGGDSLISAFLAEDLADELILLVTPELAGGGGRVEMHLGQRRQMTLLGSRAVDAGILRLHYAIRKD